MHSRDRSTSMGELCNFLKRPLESESHVRKKAAVVPETHIPRRDNVEVSETAPLDPKPGPSPPRLIWECSGFVSPEPESSKQVSESRRMILGGFLEYCTSCKKRLDPGKDIFMYRDMSAFCSPACRDKQIMLDEIQGKSSPKAINRAAGSSLASCHLKNNNMKGQVDGRYEKSAAS